MFLPTNDSNPNEKEKAEFEGPLSLLYRSVIKMTPVLVSLRNNRKILGRVVAYDRHYNLLMTSAREIGVLVSKNKGKKKREEGREISRDLGNMFVRGDGVILVASASLKKD